jgi:transposase
MTNKKRKKYRKKHAKPILNQLKKWAESQVGEVLPKSLLNKAINYMLKHWYGLIRYLEAGHLKPDNNTAEQVIRAIAPGRKNWLFVGSDRGGRAAAILFSIVQSCKIQGINPWEYLIDMLTRLPYCKNEEDYRALIPGYWKKDNAGL